MVMTKFSSSVAPILAGVTYFGIVFSIAFLFGTIRVILIVPRVGELIAVVMEMPAVLMVSWKSACWTVGKYDIAQRFTDRATMGGVAFVTLICAELSLSVVAFGKTPSEFRREQTSSTPKLLGLAGQVLYGLFPIIEGRLKHRLQREKDA